MKKACIFESSYHIIIISQVFVVKLQAFLLGPILESKGMLAIFQKKGKKRGKYSEIWAKLYNI